MKKCLILGGGFAGLTSAVYLSKAGFNVKLIEASPKLGGRAYSYYDKDLGAVIDNGQHILMGCYKETLAFLKTIGSLDQLKFQDNLEVNFLKENNELYQLRANNLPYPLGLIVGLLNFNALNIADRLKILKFFLKLPFISEKDIEKLSVLEWLKKEGQNEIIRKVFWDFLAIGALNTNPSKASAKTFLIILKEMFLRGKKAATIILPLNGLSETYCVNARQFIERNGGEIILSEKVEELIIENNKVKAVKTSKNSFEDFDFIISSLPGHSLEKIIGLKDKIIPPDFEYSSILSIHIKLNNNKLPDTFYGLIGSSVHWLFNHKSHITIVISDADGFMDLSKEDILEIACNELSKYLNIKKKEISEYKIIKEKRATFVPSNKITDKRLFAETNLKNFFLAGDWVDTGLPSTIESAVKSGRTAAELVIKKYGAET